MNKTRRYKVLYVEQGDGTWFHNVIDTDSLPDAIEAARRAGGYHHADSAWVYDTQLKFRVFDTGKRVQTNEV